MTYNSIILFFPGAAGAVDEEYFQKAFEDVPSVPLMSHKEIDDVMGKIKDNICIQDYWEKRVEAVSSIVKFKV